MTNNVQIFSWARFRKFWAFAADDPITASLHFGSLTFQVVESEICVADALLDLGDLSGFNEHSAKAHNLASELAGKESQLITKRLERLRARRMELNRAALGVVPLTKAQ